MKKTIESPHIVNKNPVLGLCVRCSPSSITAPLPAVQRLLDHPHILTTMSAQKQDFGSVDRGFAEKRCSRRACAARRVGRSHYGRTTRVDNALAKIRKVGRSALAASLLRSENWWSSLASRRV